MIIPLHMSLLTLLRKFILTYGAGIGGGGGESHRTSNNKINIYSTDISFINIKRYKTILTDTLNIITGIPSIAITFKYDYTKSNILHLK